MAITDGTKVMRIQETIPSKPLSSFAGIGIVEFVRGKNYFVTGATGFIAKALIEKILPTDPNVGRIFLMIKGKDKEAIQRRLRNEIIGDELFKCLKKVHGIHYEAFMMMKLVPVLGDLCKWNLGMDTDLADEITKQIHIIVNLAAATSFMEWYDVALDINTKGPSQLLDFAKKCKNLNLFLHVSTAYVNGEREGTILEKPFHLGQSIVMEKNGSKFPILDISSELKLAYDTRKSLVDDIEMSKKMKDLGTKRANIFGWQNTYVFTKAMGEMLIDSERENVPVVIIRPSITKSSYREPFQGWIQRNRVIDPVFISYGKGQLPGFNADPKTVLDIVPVDMVVNVIIAAIAKHGIDATPQLFVYQVSSSVSNPITFGDIFDYAYDYFTSLPILDSQGRRVTVEKLKYFNSLESFSSYIEDEIAQQVGLKDAVYSINPKLHLQMQMEWRKITKRLIDMAQVYEPYGFYKGRFDDSNTKKLIKDMSSAEEKKFGFNVEDINWKHYITSVHLPGVRRYITKELLGIAARL